MASEKEKLIVRERAQFRCEYCKAPEGITGYAFHIEHIQPAENGGQDHLENYALSCVTCNRAKWYHQHGRDPKTGKIEPIFDPRKDKWSDHFPIEARIYIRGRSAIGRVTEDRLKVNQKRQLEARRWWIALDLFP